MVRATSLLIAVAASLLVAGGASASARGAEIGAWRPVNGADGLLLADGARYVATGARQGAVRLQDTATGKRRLIAPPACDSATSHPRAIGGGMLVWECASLVAPRAHLLVVDDLSSGRRFLPPGLAQFQALEMYSSDAAQFVVHAVGRHWIYLTRSGYHYADDVLVGLDRSPVVRQPPRRADIAVDPDRLTGGRRICRGIRRRSGFSELGQLPFGLLEYHPPYAITGSGRLRACTGAPPVPRGPHATDLSDRFLSWAAGRLVRIRSTTGHGTGRRNAPDVVRGIGLTRRFVYVTTGSGTHIRVYRARLGAR